ncbi:oxidoreductase [Bacillus dakarensis]|uniref:oxidoreductase n=1 Tax=Robertmurraya dakarensis TaxID=1926278 RepID=UPI000981944B|nr:oxidoreductase [Bacillus dakarensis]
MKTALIAGASGLVGSELLQILLQAEEYEKVYALVRRPLGLQHSKLTEVLCDFEQLEGVQDYFQVHDVFCCLGTTIKKAKTKEAMYKVDVEYPLAIAKLAQEKGAHHFLLISSMNANPRSKIWYPKMKGDLEEKIKEIPYQAISIFRPSLLLGNREEFRLGENAAAKIFQGMSFILKDSWKSKLAIEAKSVAKAMCRVAQMDNKGVAVYSAASIEEIARAPHHK